ncbi:MAG: ribosome small subunit-dependent GTPase A [Verrucomicrobia bacterium]|nr:MAG: ribosome small subunit-dependent GTPase A [Verrucomicrobiota bacterium]
MDLQLLGWDDAWDAAFAAHRASGKIPARVVNEEKHYFTVVAATGPFLAQIDGNLLHRRKSIADLPKVGDWVACTAPVDAGVGGINAVLPRRSQLARKVTGRESAGQVLAANIDVAFLVQALGEPLNLRRLERFLVMAHEGGTRPVVVLNKSDLCDDLEARLAEATAAAGDAPVVATSARTGRALPRLRALVRPGETVVFIGTSGVGKSSLVNRLYGERIQATIPVREADSKGRHATTARELILLPGGGLVIDTPGVREFHLWLADAGLDEAFPDIAALASGCRFRDCGHRTESPCAVRTAVEAGVLSKERHESYLKLQAELAAVAARKRRHQHMKNRHRAKTGTKAYLRIREDDGE